MVALKDLFNRAGSGRTRHEALPADASADTRGAYLANSAVLGVDTADAILLVGANPRAEAPVYNARIRKAFLNGAQARRPQSCGIHAALELMWLAFRTAAATAIADSLVVHAGVTSILPLR